MFFRKEIPEELTDQRFFTFWIFLYFIYMLLGYVLTDHQLMEVEEKSEILDVDERYTSLHGVAGILYPIQKS